MRFAFVCLKMTAHYLVRTIKVIFSNALSRSLLLDTPNGILTEIFVSLCNFESYVGYYCATHRLV